jgi:hypothetical protein
MVQRWLPNFEEFFHSLGRLIGNSERQLHSQNCSEYLIRCLDEYERTVSTLLSRLNETYQNMPDVLRSFQDIEFLRNCLGTLCQEFESRSNNMQDDNCEEYNLRSRLENTNEGRGRPRVDITPCQLEALHNAEGFR